MDKKKTEILITVCLLIIFVWAVASGAKAMLKKKQGEKGDASVFSVSANDKKQKRPLFLSPPPSAARNDKLGVGLGRDPFSRQAAVEDLSLGPVNAQEGNINGIVLTGIVYDTKNSAENYCIINSEVIKLGEPVAGFTLTGIKEGSAVLTNEKEGKDYCLSLWDDGS